MWRMYQARQRFRTGRKPGSGSAKKSQYIIDTSENHDSRTLIFYDMTDLAQTTTNAINARNRAIAMISGFKMRMWVRNNRDEPLLLRMALLRAKNAKVISTDGFFREYTTSRDRNFSTGLSAMEFWGSPISTDKYSILWSKKKLLAGRSPTTNVFVDRSRANYFLLNKYYRLKRQLAFNDDTDDACETPVFFVMWADSINKQPLDPVDIDAYQSQKQFITYFREPKYTF